MSLDVYYLAKELAEKRILRMEILVLLEVHHATHVRFKVPVTRTHGRREC